MEKSLCVFGILLATSILYGQGKEDSVHYQLAPVTITATRVAEGWLEVPLAINILKRKSL